MKSADTKCNQYNAGAEGEGEGSLAAESYVHSENIENIDLSNRNIGDQGAKEMAEQLKASTVPHTIDLSSNDIGDEGVEWLVKQLKDLKVPHNIDLSDNNIGDQGASWLAEYLKDSKVPHNIDLSNNNIGDEGASWLAEYLTNKVPVPHNIDLSNNNIGDEGAKEMAKHLKDSKVPHTINLSRNKIGDQGAEWLAWYLKDSTHSHTINLSANKIGDEGAEWLAKHLKASTHSHTINLGATKIRDVGAGWLAMHLKASTHSHNIDLSWNNIGDYGAKEMAKHLKDSKVPHNIDLSDNNIGDEGAKEMAKHLKDSTRSHTINLSGNGIGFLGVSWLENCLTNKVPCTIILLSNKIGAQGAKWMAERLKASTHSHTINLSGLSGNKIGAKGAEWLAGHLKDSTNSHTINFSGNKIGAQGAKWLAGHLKDSTNSHTINLSGNKIGDEGAGWLAKFLKDSTNSHTINLSGNKIGDEGAGWLAKFLKASTHSHTINLSGNDIGDYGAEELSKKKEEEARKVEGYYSDIDVLILVDALLTSKGVKRIAGVKHQDIVEVLAEEKGEVLAEKKGKITKIMVLAPINESAEEGIIDALERDVGRGFDNQIEQILVPIVENDFHWYTVQLLINYDRSEKSIEAIIHDSLFTRSFSKNIESLGQRLGQRLKEKVVIEQKEGNLPKIQQNTGNEYCGGYTARLIAHLVIGENIDDKAAWGCQDKGDNELRKEDVRIVNENNTERSSLFGRADSNYSAMNLKATKEKKDIVRYRLDASKKEIERRLVEIGDKKQIKEILGAILSGNEKFDKDEVLNKEGELSGRSGVTSEKNNIEIPENSEIYKRLREIGEANKETIESNKAIFKHFYGFDQEKLKRDEKDKSINVNPEYFSQYGMTYLLIGMYEVILDALCGIDNNAIGGEGAGASGETIEKGVSTQEMNNPAASYSDKATEIKPDKFELYRNKGACFYQLGKYNEAIECYSKAIEIEPDKFGLYRNKGACFYQLGKYNEAIECYSKAIEIEPDKFGLYRSKGACFYQLGKYNEAIECYDKAINLDPKEALFYSNKGDCLQKQDQWEEAIKCYEEAIKCYEEAKNIDSDHASAKLNMQKCLKKLKEKARADDEISNREECLQKPRTEEWSKDYWEKNLMELDKEISAKYRCEQLGDEVIISVTTTQGERVMDGAEKKILRYKIEQARSNKCKKKKKDIAKLEEILGMRYEEEVKEVEDVKDKEKIEEELERLDRRESSDKQELEERKGALEDKKEKLSSIKKDIERVDKQINLIKGIQNEKGNKDEEQLKRELYYERAFFENEFALEAMAVERIINQSLAQQKVDWEQYSKAQEEADIAKARNLKNELEKKNLDLIKKLEVHQCKLQELKKKKKVFEDCKKMEEVKLGKKKEEIEGKEKDIIRKKDEIEKIKAEVKKERDGLVNKVFMSVRGGKVMVGIMRII